MSFILYHVKGTNMDEIPLNFLHMNYRIDSKSANMYEYLCLSIFIP